MLIGVYFFVAAESILFKNKNAIAYLGTTYTILFNLFMSSIICTSSILTYYLIHSCMHTQRFIKSLSPLAYSLFLFFYQYHVSINFINRCYNIDHWILMAILNDNTIHWLQWNISIVYLFFFTIMIYVLLRLENLF